MTIGNRGFLCVSSFKVKAIFIVVKGYSYKNNKLLK